MFTEPEPQAGRHRSPKNQHTPLTPQNDAASESERTVNLVLPDDPPGEKPPAPQKDKAQAPPKDGSKHNLNANTNAEVSAVPDPVPAGAANSPTHAQPSYSVHTVSLFVASKTPDSILPLAAPTSPPLTLTAPPGPILAPSPISQPSLSATPTSSLSSSNLPSASDASPPTDASNQSNLAGSHSTVSHHTVIVILISVGGACILGVVFILVKIWLRPKRRSHPTPSLPILQDAFPAEKGDESPIFGGKERLSSRPPSNAVLWPWTQYHSGIPKPQPVATTRTEVSDPISQRRYSRLDDDLPAATIQHATAASYAQPTVQHVPEKPLRNVSRLSTMSVAYMPPAGQDIGVAVTSGHEGLTRNPSAGGYNKRASIRRSMRDFESGKRRSTVYTDAETLPYAASPSMPTEATADVGGHAYAQGRARIKAPYGAGSYLRASTATSAAATKRASTMTEMNVNPFDDAAYVVPPIPPLEPTHQRELREAKTTRPPSPGPTLYPDDSLSVAGDRRRVPQPKKHAAQGKIGSPVEASAALGTLMLSDYRASKMSPSMESEGPEESQMYESDREAGHFAFRKRADDKPPRVPSPPPLPSLAQMAMAHTNQSDFGDYRSPTYSIYGLYDPDRKSHADGGY